MTSTRVLFAMCIGVVFSGGCAATGGRAPELSSEKFEVVEAPCVTDAECDSGEFCDLLLCIPEGPPCPAGGVCRTQTRFYANNVMDIPDADPAGVESPLQVERPPASIAQVRVNGLIRHTWRGDLQVVLRSPSGTEHVIHNRQGAGADDLSISSNVTEFFDGEPAQGEWTLVVRDLARQDTGRLMGWNLDFQFALPAPEPTPGYDVWATVELPASESEHPYANNTDETLDLRRFSSDAGRARIRFARLEVERGYDFVEVLDLDSGEVLDRFTGTLAPFTTREYPTGNLGVRLVSDYSVTAWGYQIGAVEVFGKGCLEDADCPSGTQCPNELVRCVAWPCFLGCAPETLGGEGASCSSSDQCQDALYCAGDGTCRADGSCNELSDCDRIGNTYYRILCIGRSTCEDNRCGYQCGTPLECVEGDTTDDGCNTCTCAGGMWVCTERYCPPIAGAGEACGGGTLCEEGFVCDGVVTDGPTCSSEQPGVCVAEPTAPRYCRGVYAPVCTCGGQTFDGSCQREGMGAWAHDGECTLDMAIPDADAAGIQTTVSVSYPRSSTRALVEVRIDHTWRGDLVVWVEAPDGTEHELTNRAGGSADDFAYEDIIDLGTNSVAGDWTFHVSDRASQDTGVLRHVNVRPR